MINFSRCVRKALKEWADTTKEYLDSNEKIRVITRFRK